MANGGGSRIGGFVRGVLAGLVFCAIAAVALSLWMPQPVPVAPAAPGATGGQEPSAMAPGAGTAPRNVTAIPAEPAQGTAGNATPPATGGGAVAPQPTWSQGGASGTGGATDTGSNFSDEPPAGAGGAASAPPKAGGTAGD